MANIALRDDFSPVSRQITREMSRHMERMRVTYEKAMAAADQVSDIHSYTAYRAASTLELAAKLKLAMGNLSPETIDAFLKMDGRYLERLSLINDRVSRQAIESITQTFTDDRSMLDKIADWLDGE